MREGRGRLLVVAYLTYIFIYIFVIQEKHFPTLLKEVHCYRSSKDHRDVMTRIMITACEAIEDKFGRLAPSVYIQKLFDQNPLQVIQSINAEKHLDEKQGSTFLDIIDHKAIKSYLQGRNNSYGQSGRNFDQIQASPALAPAVKEAVKIPPLMQIPVVPKIPAVTKDISPPKTLTAKERAKRNSLDSISSLSDSSLAKSPKKKEKPAPNVVGTIDLRSMSRSLSPLSDDELVPEPKEVPRPILPSPNELAIQSSEITKEKYSWEKYRCLVELAVKQLQKTLKENEKNPEKHPLYPEEWKKFWNRRYKELQAEKKDPSKHDFKPEWIIFWTRRMHELHLVEVEAKKEEIRKRLNLPAEGVERDMRQQYAVKINLKTTSLDDRIRKGPSPRSNVRKRSPARRSYRDDSPDARRRNASPRRRRSSRSKSPQSRRRSRSKSPKSRRRLSRSKSPQSRRRKSRSTSNSRQSSKNHQKGRSNDIRNLSPVSDESNDSRRRRERSRSPHRSGPSVPAFIPPLLDFYGPHHGRPAVDEWGRPIYYPPVQRPPTYYYREKEQKLLEEEETEPVTVVSVLRLLTALEDLLGSLGPKVIDLLAKALALEKVKANSSDEMLVNEDTSVLFETIKEKLKGQLIANVVEKHKIAAVKRAVKNVAIITHVVSERAKLAVKDIPEEIIAAPIAVAAPSVDSASAGIDKAAIAQKIATALVMQGKTDVTSEQLEELINVYIAMQQKAKESKEIVTTANYLETVEPTTPAVPAPIEPTKAPVTNETPEAPNMLESLTDSDLETLLQNFKDLMPEEQQHLIAYLKKLELSQPLRVERLRRFVNVDVSISENKSSDDENNDRQEDQSKPLNKIMYPSRSVLQRPPSVASSKSVEKEPEMPVSSRSTSKMPIPEEIIESDDDDYSYDDVFRAASKNIKENSAPRSDRDEDYSNSSKSSKPAAESSMGSSSNLTNLSNLSFADTQSMIANLMGSLNKNVRPIQTTVSTAAQPISTAQHKRPAAQPISTVQHKRPEAAAVVNSDEMDLEPRVPVTKPGKVPYYQQLQQQEQSYYQQQPQSYNSSGNVSYPNGNFNQASNNVAYPGFVTQQGYQAGQSGQQQDYRQQQGYHQQQQPFQDQQSQQAYNIQQQQAFGNNGYPMANQYHAAQQQTTNQPQPLLQIPQQQRGGYQQPRFNNNFNSNSSGNQSYY